MASRVRIFPWSCTALLRPRLRLRARPPRSSRAWLTPCRKNPAAHPGGGRRRGAAGDRVRGSSPAPHRRHERLPSATGYRIPPVPHRLEPCPASPTRAPPPRHRLSNTSRTPPARALPRIADTIGGGAPRQTRPVRRSQRPPARRGADHASPPMRRGTMKRNGHEKRSFHGPADLLQRGRPRPPRPRRGRAGAGAVSGCVTGMFMATVDLSSVNYFIELTIIRVRFV